MTFDEALPLIRQGFRVRRDREWGGVWHVERAHFENVEDVGDPDCAQPILAPVRVIPAPPDRHQLSLEDIMADDWEVS